MAGHARRNPVSMRHCGGLVTITPIRDRLGEGSEAYAVSYHSPGGDLAWLSPRLAHLKIRRMRRRVALPILRGSAVRR